MTAFFTLCRWWRAGWRGASVRWQPQSGFCPVAWLFLPETKIILRVILLPDKIVSIGS